MFTGLVNHLRLTAKAKTGLSTFVFVFALLAAIAVVVAFVFFIFAVFIWLAERYSALTAALVLAISFLLIAILAALGAVMTQRSTAENAKRALAAKSHAWFDPATLGVALQIGRSIGLRRIAPLAAAGVLAAALAKEWFRDRPDEVTEAGEELDS